MRVLFAALLLLMLPGCVAFHSLPPRGYASLPAEPDAQRLILDQSGDPWPDDASAEAVLPEALDKARAFRLAERLARAGLPYDRDSLHERAARQLGGKGRVVILIRGFNNSFGTFRAEYAALRGWIAAQHHPSQGLRYLDLYWDALHRGGGKVGYPFGRFVRARGNAERAGRCGLRDVLGRLPAGTDVTVVTHSLGAEVALAALAERPARRGELPCGERAASAVPAHLGDVRLVAFAPAIGRVHLLDPEGRLTRSSLGAIDRFYVAYNPRDPAVTKRSKGLDLPDWLGGDTRLGGNAGFVASIDAKLERLGLLAEFQPLAFTQPEHAMAGYLDDATRAQCIMWAGALLVEPPESCGLSR